MNLDVSFSQIKHVLKLLMKVKQNIYAFFFLHDTGSRSLSLMTQGLGLSLSPPAPARTTKRDYGAHCPQTYSNIPA